MNRLTLVFVLLGAVATPGSPLAQYPTKPVRMIVNFASGGPADITARAVAEPLAGKLAQPVIVENRPGAEGAIAADTVRNAAPDGYTLLWGTSGAVVGVPLLRKHASYDPISSFTPVSLVGRFALCLFAHPEVPANTLSQLAKYARANPGKLSYGYSALIEAVSAAQLSKSAGIAMVRVPYKGGTSVISDLLAGRVQLGYMPVAMGMPLVKQGRLHALAILLPGRSPAAPDIPTLVEAGFPEASATPWAAVFGPAGMSGDIVERLARDINFALDTAEVRSQFERQGFQGEGSTPQALAEIVKKDLETWRQVIRETGLSLE